MWVSSLKGDPHSARIALFCWWFWFKPAHRRAFLAECERRAPLPAHLVDLEATVRRLASPYAASHTTGPIPFPRWHHATAIGCLVLTLLVLGGTLRLLNTQSQDQQHTYTTAIGGSQHVLLEDGSAMDLDTNTQVKVKFNAKRRQIALLRGQASFVVAHDTARPFYVRARDTNVRAVGTEFTVRMTHPQHVSVLVSEGRVSITHERPEPGLIERLLAHGNQGAQGAPAPQPAARAVSAGQLATDELGKMRVASIAPAAIAAREAWRSGWLRIDGWTLSQVVEEFNRYTPNRLVVMDVLTGERQISGAFKIERSDSFLRALQRVMDIQIKHSPGPAGSGEVIYLYGPTSEGTPR